MTLELNFNNVFKQPAELSSSPHYFLFLLGTDTQFTRRPTETKYYVNGESLSYSAQVISLLMKESEEETIRAPHNAHSYRTPSVDVVDGPTTFGTEVGDRIALAVYLALDAINRGKTNIQIIAHSRGAVEGVLLIHELIRIKKALSENPGKPFKKMLLETHSQYIKKGYQSLLMNSGETAEPTPEERAVFLTKLEQTLTKETIHPFLIDPVPGGRYFGMPYVRWVDKNFYEPLPCEHSLLILCRDERTRCFIPIVMKGQKPLVMFGHHGTLSGNRYTQCLGEVPHGETSCAQKLLLCKLFEFLHNSTKGSLPRGLDINLEHPTLDPIVTEYLRVDDKARHNILLRYYNEVKKNEPAFNFLAKNTYPYLGAESAKDGSRFIHSEGHNYLSLNAVCPPTPNGFVNAEHAQLFLSATLGHELKSPIEILGHIRCELINIVNTMTEPVPEDDPNVLLTNYIRDPNGRALLALPEFPWYAHI